MSSDCFKVAQRTIRRQHATLVQRTQFYGLAEAEANNVITEAATQAADLAILALFATFERFVIEHLQTANRRLSNGYPAGYSSKLAKKFEDEVEYWRLDQILDLFKDEINVDLLGQAKQIKDYRDWIAHRNPRRAPPAQAEPRATFEVLTQIIEQIRLVVSQRMREADTTSVSVSDYNATSCPGPNVTEITVSASLDQVQRIANALGKGDVAGAAVGAADVAAGATVSVVKGAGGVVQSIGDGVKHVVCGIFHC